MMPYVVTTACCGEDYPENDDAVTYRDGDWWCTWDEDCARWATRIRDAGEGITGIGWENLGHDRGEDREGWPDAY